MSLISSILENNAGAGLGGSDICARIYRSTPQTYAHVAFTQLVFDSVRYDTDGMFNIAAPTLLTINTPGVYRIGACILWEADMKVSTTQDQFRGLIIIQGGGETLVRTYRPSLKSSSVSPALICTTEQFLFAGETISAFAQQDLGDLPGNPAGNLDVLSVAQFTAEFWARRVDKGG